MRADAPFSAHPDGRPRCPWPGTDPLYVAYHDEEWGVPEFDSRALFEKLILDGFQAGLSWITILRRRNAFRAAFDDFDPEAIARYDAEKIAALMDNPAIIRNRAKIEGTVASARAYLEIERRKGFPTSCGSSSTGGRSGTASAAEIRSRRSLQKRWPCQKASRNAASNSAARRSSMPSVRRQAWSMITSSRAGVMRSAPP